MFKFLVSITLALLLSLPTVAQMQGDWKKGDRVAGYGPVAQGVKFDALDPQTSLKVAFDIYRQAEEGTHSRQLDSVARFLNMHRFAGLSDDKVTAAIVVHGGAVRDMIKAEPGDQKNQSALLISRLLEAGVTITVCGQSAAAQGVSRDDLLPGIAMSLSAMTAHALLAKDGYSLNPF